MQQFINLIFQAVNFKETKGWKDIIFFTQRPWKRLFVKILKNDIRAQPPTLLQDLSFFLYNPKEWFWHDPHPPFCTLSLNNPFFHFDGAPYPLHNFVIKCPEEANIWTNILLACARSLTLFKLDSDILSSVLVMKLFLVNSQTLKRCNLFHVNHRRNGED